MTPTRPAYTIMPPLALAMLRAVNESNLLHLATVFIEPVTGARVGGALVDATPEMLYENVPCRLSVETSRARGGAVTSAGQQNNIGRWTLAVAEGASEIPENAIVHVSGLHADGTPWTRAIRIVSNEQTRGMTCMGKYQATDLGPSGG